jgi:hypothetical protein
MIKWLLLRLRIWLAPRLAFLLVIDSLELPFKTYDSSQVTLVDGRREPDVFPVVFHEGHDRGYIVACDESYLYSPVTMLPAVPDERRQLCVAVKVYPSDVVILFDSDLWVDRVVVVPHSDMH